MVLSAAFSLWRVPLQWPCIRKILQQSVINSTYHLSHHGNLSPTSMCTWESPYKHCTWLSAKIRNVLMAKRFRGIQRGHCHFQTEVHSEHGQRTDISIFAWTPINLSSPCGAANCIWTSWLEYPFLLGRGHCCKVWSRGSLHLTASIVLASIHTVALKALIWPVLCSATHPWS